jgi:DNA-binding XRE family transcriptional regulator
LIGDEIKMITGAQIRGARAILRWSAEDLARSAGLGAATVRRAEAEDGAPNMLIKNAIALKEALEEAGIEFTYDPTPGLRMKEDFLLLGKNGKALLIQSK